MNREPTSTVDEEGTKVWRLDGKVHRTDGPAIEYADGNKYWFVDGKQHRIDGPAIELANGTKYWFVDGKIHRLDGPAIELADGNKFWYIDDKELTEEEFNQHPAVCMYKQKQQIKKDLTSNKDFDDDTRDDLEAVLLDL